MPHELAEVVNGAALLARQLPSRNALAEAMNPPRYLRLLATLQTWKSQPPFERRIRGRQLVKRARRAAGKADRRLVTGLHNHRHESLHRARKAAKRARYAAELHKPVRKPARAKSNIKYYKKIQRLLGDYNDSVVSTEFLRRTATAAGTAGDENGFTYGLLYANEMHATERAPECHGSCRRRIDTGHRLPPAGSMVVRLFLGSQVTDRFTRPTTDASEIHRRPAATFPGQ
ncbi:CHAD domain-containing protein [Nocardia sp. GCM10030253]|uniref:CHAD domain-containing protein n=1 Tax=Nocardia sp. GCM10030253 TaxID=3273404 RepID=UPI00363B2C52